MLRKIKSATKLFICSTLLLTSTLGSCQKAKETTFKTVKVDLDFSGRKVEEVNDPNYQSWVIEEGQQAEKILGNTKVTFSGVIRSNWYKVGVHAPAYAQLVSDGLVAQGLLTMTLEGLPAGKHSLLTFHNAFDNPANNTFSPIHIYSNGKKIKTVAPSIRALATIDAAMAYFTFEVKNGEIITITFEPANGDYTKQEVVLNGFELDGANMQYQARNPFPADLDEHVAIGEGFALQWEAPKGATKHKLYLGTSKEVVANATEDSEVYKGLFTNTSYALSNLYSGRRYFWRVDEITPSGEVTKGEVWMFKPAQLAFPGAEGYGRFAIGGRGGKVVEVTNLNDDGPGSLREAVTNDIGPRTIVFAVSGVIELKSRLVVSQPYVTIAGQTAPGKGITITRAPVGLTGDDGVIRFLRVRLGAGRTFDGMGLTGADYSIIDHCSISWTIDESFSSRGAHHITLQRTLISEALNIAGHTKYGTGKMHGYAATIGGDIGSFHHNLLAHNYGRNWSMGGGLNGDGYYSGKLDIRNNVVYNWGHRATDGGANQVNFVNNYYKPGKSTDFFYALNAQHEGVGLGKQQYYFDGNIMEGVFKERNQKKGRKATISNNEKVNYDTFVNEPFFESYVTTEAAGNAYKSVLSDVGMNLPLDDHDKRIIKETLNGTFTYRGSKSGLAGMIDTEQDVGGLEDYPEEHRALNWDTDHDGLPDWWENWKGLNIHSAKGDFSDSNLDENKDGYTQLDEYLDWMAQEHYIVDFNGNITLKLTDLFAGFENKVSYKLISGTATIEEDKMTIPCEKGEKNNQIIVEATDKSGFTMKRKVNVYVK